MQIYANVAGDPVWTIPKTEGLKGCWQFRAGEAFKERDGAQQESTWYTVKDYATSEHETPAYGKGDFLKILGRLKPAAWMNRKGCPETTLYVHAFDVSIERKVGQKTVTQSKEPAKVLQPVAEVAEVKEAGVQVAPTLELELVVPKLAGNRLLTAVKGIFQGSVDDAPDWKLA